MPIRFKPKDPKGIRFRLKQLREEKGWSKAEAARRIGVPTSTYSNWEYGIRQPTQDNANRAAKVFDTTLTFIFNGGERTHRSKNSTSSDNLALLKTKDDHVVFPVYLQDIVNGTKIFADQNTELDENDRTLLVNIAKSILERYSK